PSAPTQGEGRHRPPEDPLCLARHRLARYCTAALLACYAFGAVAENGFFADATVETGLDFVHFNGMSGELYFVEMMGPGGALFDYDRDGDLDVFIVQGTPLDDQTQSPQPAGDRLYRNDLVRQPDGTAAPRFVDVTGKSGIRENSYGMGVATGDFDNDGWTDLYVLNFGRNQLWRNRTGEPLAGGRSSAPAFADVTAGSGAGDRRWSIGASVVDYDRDGWLDIYVVNYVHFEVENNVVCYAASSRRDYCGPDAFKPVADGLLRNLGGSAGGSPGEIRFEDVSLSSGIAREVGPGLGVVAADFDGDGWSDFYVANDGKPNYLWLSRRLADGGVGFTDESLLAGVAVNREGRPEASMGVAAADYDNDGDEDLFITHLMGETNTLYVNDGSGLFEDLTAALGLGPPSLASTSFGTGWLDVDNDGWLDLMVVNGAVKILESLVHEGDDFPLDHPNQFFKNLGGRGFEDATAAAGPTFAVAEVSRGTAFGDVDNDGDVDALVLNTGDRPRLLLNRVGQRRRWLGWRLLDANGRDALGARVSVERSPAGGGAPSRRVASDGSFSSANDPRVLFGLGDGAAAAVRVRWPGGSEQRWRLPASGRYVTVRSRE
ncbi:MAG: CRTAC1 family protein, partial [Thermoanaerobaculia bacterium]